LALILCAIPVCWLLIFLSHSPTWKAKVISELDNFVIRHSQLPESEPLHKRVASIKLSAWESDELPFLDAVIKETIRIVLNIATLRRNVMADLKLDGKTIPKGNFLTYHIADIHLDPEIYPDPMKFDPDRYERGQGENVRYGYLGWGAGE
jgi:cytochrome P450